MRNSQKLALKVKTILIETRFIMKKWCYKKALIPVYRKGEKVKYKGGARKEYK
jgi:hypothetical protein